MRRKVRFQFMQKMGLLNFDVLRLTEQELFEDIYSSGLTPELYGKLCNLNHCIILALQNHSITIGEYGILLGNILCMLGEQHEEEKC